MNSTELLIETRELIEPPDNWTAYYAARDADGQSVHPESGDAVQWCAIGALENRAKIATTNENIDAYKYALMRLGAAAADILGEDNVFISQVNDELGHDWVMAMYDRAIEQTS